jgi:hypothetical protein
MIVPIRHIKFGGTKIMKKYYFTYGLEDHPFKGGWTIVRADSRETAVKAFEIFHPAKTSQLLNCAAVYSEEAFRGTLMYRKGNFGAYTQEFIDIYHTVVDEEDFHNEE